MRSMTEEEIKEYCKRMKEFGEKVCSSKESAMAFLVATGIYDKDGNLTEHYRGE